MRGCNVTAPVDREQHFFLHVFGIGGVILPAGQMAEVCPHGRADRFQRFDCAGRNISKSSEAFASELGAGNRT